MRSSVRRSRYILLSDLGLLESAYESCLAYELERQKMAARRRVLLPMRYGDLTVDNGYRIDLLIRDRVVIELKAVVAILPVHRAQFLSYLRLGVSSWVIC